MKFPFQALNPEVWNRRRVLLTGHTGFKGAWMALLLNRLGANITGISLDTISTPNLFEVLSPWSNLNSILCDIRDLPSLKTEIEQTNPEIVIHMAAQALVKESYRDPVGTICSNVLGTIHLLEVLREIDSIRGILIITSDKVYENQDGNTDFNETAALGGYDPYSASKAAADILTRSYYRSFFKELNIPVMVARAGNVIGGGDWAPDRLIPDLWRAYENQKPVQLRNPDAVRPWQHVLDPLYGYLLYIQQFISSSTEVPSCLNFGPPNSPTLTVMQVAEQFANSMQCKNIWEIDPSQNKVHESSFLAIDSKLAFETLGWKTKLKVDEAIQWACDWYKAYNNNKPMKEFTEKQIDKYTELIKQA